MQKDWTEYIKGLVMFLVAFLPSLFAIYKLIHEWIESSNVKVKERSVGETKVKELEKDLSDIKTRLDSFQKFGHEIEKSLDRVQDNQEKIRDTIQHNMQESMNILMRGKQ